MCETDAFVHITVAAGETAPTASAVTDVERVRTAHVVTGDYDIVAQLDLDDPGVDTHDWLQTEIDEDEREESVTDVVEQIRAIDGVEDTTTNLAFEV
jgi:anthranilate phosphoribosyltransferase